MDDRSTDRLVNESRPDARRRRHDDDAPALLRDAAMRLEPAGRMAASLGGIGATLGEDLCAVETILQSVAAGDGELERCARHLVRLPGKRLRPLCLLLASRIGPGPAPDATSLAAAVEIIHCATLLHDDVVDEGNERRGAPAARVVHGNAVAVLAGDWLLVDALQRIEAACDGALLSSALEMLRAMATAESLQLALREERGPDRAAYVRIANGKTGALFAWALRAGAVASGAPRAHVEALARYGSLLGLAFQIIDDVLDLEGHAIGKDLLQDALHGQASYPLALARERQPLGEPPAVATGEPENADAWRARLIAWVEGCGALATARRDAADLAEAAVDAIASLPGGPARRALATIASHASSRAR
jgi:octaprenyl-diphosphate synthase